MTKGGVMTKGRVMTAALRSKMITKADRCLPSPDAALKRSYFGADALGAVILYLAPTNVQNCSRRELYPQPCIID
jgi:hypothetical protein